METRVIDGELYFRAGYRFKQENADELRDTMQRRGQIVEITEGLLSGHGVRGKFENKRVYEIWARSQ